MACRSRRPNRSGNCGWSGLRLVGLTAQYPRHPSSEPMSRMSHSRCQLAERQHSTDCFEVFYVRKHQGVPAFVSRVYTRLDFSASHQYSEYQAEGSRISRWRRRPPVPKDIALVSCDSNPRCKRNSQRLQKEDIEHILLIRTWLSGFIVSTLKFLGGTIPGGTSGLMKRRHQ